MIKLISIFIVITLLMPPVISAEIYKWINDDGSIGLTDDLSNVPGKYRDQVEIKKYRDVKSTNDIPDKKPRESIVRRIKNESIAEVDQEQEQKQKLSPEELKKIDEELRGIWNDMKKSLKGR